MMMAQDYETMVKSAMGVENKVEGKMRLAHLLHIHAPIGTHWHTLTHKRTRSHTLTL